MATKESAAGRRWWIAAAVALVVVAAVVAVIVRRSAGDRGDVALAATRGLEVRLTAAAFDRHRPLGAVAPERIAPETMTALAHDPHGLAAARLIAGDLAGARAALAQAAAAPERDSDGAAIAFAARDAEAALALASAAIDRAPQLAQAHWNRAQVLRWLGLPLAAAAALDQVVAQGEPGWADEARRDIDALRTGPVQQISQLTTYRAAADAMIAGGPPVAAALVRQHPGLARKDLYAALAVAGSAEEARALAPVAAALDQLAKNPHASAAVTAVVARDFAARRRFQARIRALIAGTLADADVPALLDELARAGDAVADLRLLAVVELPPVVDEPALAPAADPWAEIELARHAAQRANVAGDPLGAERALIAAQRPCGDPAWAMACATVQRDLASLYVRMHRLAEAGRQLDAARAGFTAAGAHADATRLLVTRVELARLAGHPAEAAAYLEELGLRDPGDCATIRAIEDTAAALAFEAGDVAGARLRLPPSDRCNQLPSAARVIQAIDLARLGTGVERERAGPYLAGARRDRRSPSIAAAIGEGRMRIDDEPATAELVQRGLGAIVQLGAEPRIAAELRAWGVATLITDAGKRGDFAGALALFGQELAVELPAACVVALSLDNDRAVAVTRGADGAIHGSYQPERALAPIAADTIVPPELASTLAGCPDVAVVARPPLAATTQILPAALPWSVFARARPDAAAAKPARAVVVRDPRPPATFTAPAAPASGHAPAAGAPGTAPAAGEAATTLAGTEATPAKVLAALADATYVELHATAIVDTGDAALIALSDDPQGFALGAPALRAAHLTGAPVVVLPACIAYATPRDRTTRWTLPGAFLAAGARAVIAAPTIPDAALTELRARLARGEAPAAAAAAVRAAGAPGLLVFE